MSKMKLELEGFNELVGRYSKLDGDVKGITEKAIEESHNYVTANLQSAISPHTRTGRTESSLIRQAKVEWQGLVASSGVGFDLSNGGFPSIFLMYGTPRIKKDQRLYNAVYGKGTKEEILRIQENVLFEALRKAGG